MEEVEQEDELTTDPDFGSYTSHYFGSMGPNVVAGSFTEVVASGEAFIGLDGVFSPRSLTPSAPQLVPAYFRPKFGKTFADIRDGSSNTLGFAEVKAYTPYFRDGDAASASRPMPDDIAGLGGRFKPLGSHPSQHESVDRVANPLVGRIVLELRESSPLRPDI